MISINVHRGQWMDEIPDADPVPALDHVYTLMLMELGPPNMRWLLSPGANNGRVEEIAAAFGLKVTRQTLVLQYINWYERNQKTRKPTTP